MRLQAGMPCSTAAAAAEIERVAEEVLAQPSSSTGSPTGTPPMLFIHRCTYTHTHLQEQ